MQIVDIMVTNVKMTCNYRTVITPLGPNFLWPVGTPKFPNNPGGFGVSAVLPTTGTLTINLNSISAVPFSAGKTLQRNLSLVI